jgi:hypothetical protein
MRMRAYALVETSAVPDTPNQRSIQMPTKLTWGLGFLAIIAPSTIAAGIFFYNPDPDRLNEAIVNIGFYPITPPTNLRAPGSIYQVSADGKQYTMLCEVKPERLLPVMRTSPTNKQVSTELRKVRLGMSSAVQQQFESTADAKLIEATKLELDDVEVLEVSLEDLAIIATELMSRGTCGGEVQKYLEAGDYVCQGQQVLKATTIYTVTLDNVASGALKRTTELIKFNYASDATLEGGKIIAGKNLYYGMKLTPRCMYLPNQSSKRPPVTSRWQRVSNYVPILEFFE